MKKIITGIRRHPKRFLFALFFGFCTVWACVEPFIGMLGIEPKNNMCYCIPCYIIATLVLAVITVYPKRAIKFDLINTNTKVVIEFGDLFNTKGYRVIPVNEYFDSSIGRPVSPNSLHGYFIKNILGGHSNIFDGAVDKQLMGKEVEISARPEGKNKKFALGTTVILEHAESLYFLFALCNSDNDCKATCSPSLMLKAMEGLWEKVRVDGNQFDINLPLIGNGSSGVGLPPSQLLQLTLMSLLKYTKEKELSSTIRIILLEDMFEKIDLEIIKNNWQ